MLGGVLLNISELTLQLHCFRCK